MTSSSPLSVTPQLVPPLDPSFCPPALFHRRLGDELKRSGQHTPLVLGLERPDKTLSRFSTEVFTEDHPWSQYNTFYVERLVKYLLWQRGGCTVYVGGPRGIGEHIVKLYSKQGQRRFDHQFMGKKVFGSELRIVPCSVSEVPPANETGKQLGRHLDGCRIGFDLGASDRKVSAVIDGKVVYSEEVVWEPRKQRDPDYHYREIMAAITTAASKLPHVDAIGGSSAGVYIDNRPVVASLYRGIPEQDFGRISDLFLRISREMKVPLEIINDGDVTALAGSMSLQDNGILGIAMGSSLASGYVDSRGNIMGWLNELAFAPADYNPEAPVDEWSGDRGCGALYFSQQCVFRLAPAAGIEIPEDITDAAKLKLVQERLEAGDEGARKIWQTMGVYLGYALAQHAEFYDIKHVLILGRCTSGRGGELLLHGARKVLETEFPELVDTLHVQLPDEKSRRVGQSIAAASLPALRN